MTVHIENIVKGFSRYHKYTLGTDLRNLSRAIVRLIVRANSEMKKAETLTALRDTIEEMKITVRVCKDAKALKNFSSFKHLMEEVISLSKQCEGWLKSVRVKG